MQMIGYVMRFPLVLLAAGITLCLFPPAASCSVVDQDQIWLQAPTQFRLGKRLQFISDWSPRLSRHPLALDQMLGRSGLLYQASETASIAGGIDLVRNLNPASNHEKRLWQQIQIRRSFRGRTVSMRMRLEERWFSTLDGCSARARFLLRLTQRVPDSPVSMVAYDELFLTMHSLDGGPAAGVDRNRIFAGVSFPVTRSAAIETGYRIEYINRTDVDDEQRRQILIQLAQNI